MVNPLGPIDESKNVAPADLSALGMEASASNRSAEAQKIAGVEGKEGSSEPSVSTVKRFKFLTSAKNSLVGLFDKVGSLFSAGASASGPTSFDAAKVQAAEAKKVLANPANYTAFKTAAESLQQAAQYMNKTASTEDQKKVAAENLRDSASYNAQVQQIETLITQNQQLLDSINQITDSTQISDTLVTTAKQKAEQAAQLIASLQKNNPDIAEAATKAAELSKQMTTLTTQIETTVTAIKQAETIKTTIAQILQSAQQNNSASNLANCQQQMQAQGTKITTALQSAPNSAILKELQTLYTQNLQQLNSIAPGGSDVPILSPTGGVSSAGSSQNKAVTTGDARVSMLLTGLDDGLADILMQGFRTMIDNFKAKDSSSSASGSLSSVLNSLGKDAPQSSSEEEVQQVLESAIQNSDEGGGAYEDALGALAQAASLAAGSTSEQAVENGAIVSSLYKAATPQKTPQAFVKGYDAYASLGKAYARSSEATQAVLREATSGALNMLVRIDSSRQRGEGSRADGAASRLAHAVVDSSRTMNDVYGLILLLDQASSSVASATAHIEKKGLVSKLTENMQVFMQTGYPVSQVSKNTIQKFTQKLEKEFVEGTKRLDEMQSAMFDKRAAFIQQVLVNIASLFSGYLQ